MKWTIIALEFTVDEINIDVHESHKKESKFIQWLNKEDFKCYPHSIRWLIVS